jgi:glycine cleavage system H protein
VILFLLKLKQKEETLGKGDVFGTIEAVKTVSDMFIPVSGEVIEVNSKIDDTPEIVNKDPYGDGWLIKVKMSDYF